MATVLERPATIPPTRGANVDGFLRDLTDLCHQHGLGLTDGATLYVMEPEDYSRTFTASGESELTFA